MTQNDDNVYTYFGALLKRYNEDPAIFEKALLTIRFFQARSDYPLCAPQMSAAIGKILGKSLEEMRETLSKVANGELRWPAADELDDESIDRDEYKKPVQTVAPAQLDGFKRELTAFSIAVSPLVIELYDLGVTASDAPLGLMRVVSQKGPKLVAVRMIRTDGAYFDLRMSRADLEFMKTSIEKIIRSSYDD